MPHEETQVSSFTGRCRARGLAREEELVVILGLMLVGQARHRQRVLAPARVARRKNYRGHEASGGALAKKKIKNWWSGAA